MGARGMAGVYGMADVLGMPRCGQWNIMAIVVQYAIPCVDSRLRGNDGAATTNFINYLPLLIRLCG